MTEPTSKSSEGQRFPANLGVDYANSTLLPPVGSDEPLVRAYLKKFLAAADSPREFAAYIDSDYLKHLWVFILAPANQVPPSMTAADYARFVRLAADHERVVSWD